MHETQSRVDVLSELQSRFELLELQYSSDLKRLESIAEASDRLGQLKEEHCPVCGALAEHQAHEHRPAVSLMDVAGASRAEANKIRALMTDLKQTTIDNNLEIDRLVTQLNAYTSEFDIVVKDVRERVEPRVQIARSKLRESQSERDKLRLALQLQSRIDELSNLQIDISKSKTTKRNSVKWTRLGKSEIDKFSRNVESLLSAWHFPGLGRVTFSETDNDIVIGGRGRSTHGKGVRAIGHAAFNLGLLKYCREASLAHPGLILIDSPLIVYEEPDTGEAEFQPDLKDAFYRTLALDFKNEQVIIIENEKAAPPDDVNSVANIIKFTGTDHGRRGFIPISSAIDDKSDSEQ